MDDMTICIGGEAGQGLDTMGQLLTKGLIRSGYEVLVTQNYMSRIRGGHNTFTIRTGLKPLGGPSDEIHVLAALNQETIELHQNELASVYRILTSQDTASENQKNVLAVPLRELAQEKILHNVVILGCLTGMLGIDVQEVAGLLQSVFSKKDEELARRNLQAFQNGLDWVQNNGNTGPGLEKTDAPARGRLMLAGSEAVALGAMSAGVNFCSFYPMTPSTGVALNLIAHAESLGCVVEQAEDELGAINMAIGASFTGASPIVPTSGGGFALMGEGISLAGMTETPVTVVLAQRPGPATGLPTRTEQADLRLALHSGHGEFPRVIMAPGDPEECFFLTRLAMDLAQSYQTPSIIITDQFLADSYRAVPEFDLKNLSQVTAPDTSSFDLNYERYQMTQSGVSPRALPGCGPALVVADSDEHTPDGHITEAHQTRTSMVDKRRRKAYGLRQQVIKPVSSGPENPDILLLCWGSSKGAVREAAQLLTENGLRTGSIHFSQVWPLEPDHFLSLLQQAGQVINVESNASGQFAALIRQETGFEVSGSILRYDGLPLTAGYIIQKLHALYKESGYGSSQ